MLDVHLSRGKSGCKINWNMKSLMAWKRVEENRVTDPETYVLLAYCCVTN